MLYLFLIFWEAVLNCIEICAGAGGQALGLSQAGFEHIALVEYESDYCAVLKQNRPDWNVICEDVRKFSGLPYKNAIDLLAGGVPCPPFPSQASSLEILTSEICFPRRFVL